MQCLHEFFPDFLLSQNLEFGASKTVLREKQKDVRHDGPSEVGSWDFT